MTRSQQWMFIGFFTALIYSVPLAQSGAELARGHRPQFLDVFSRTPTRANLRAYENELEDASTVAAAVRPWIQYTQFVLFRDGGEKVLMGREGWLFYKPDVSYLVDSPARPAASADAFHAIVDFRDQLAARGIRLMVMPAPGKPSLYGDMLTSRQRNRLIQSPTRDLIARLRRAGVEAVDLFELFGDIKERNKAYYLVRDTHWSTEAAQMAAETVAARLKNLGWSAEGGTQYGLRRVNVSRRSDIAHMIREPRIESRFPPEDVVCNQVFDLGTGELYRDDVASPVLVMGDSFLRIYQTDQPASAGFIAHLARVLRRPVASVVNDGGASTLVRQELVRRPQLLRGKKVVVWEFVERDIRFGAEGWKTVALPPAHVYAGALP